MNRERITISLLPGDEDIKNHLQIVKKQGQSLSSYLRNLIRTDMGNSINSSSIDDLAQAIADKLENIQFNNVEKPTVQSEPVGFEEKRIIEQLF